MTKEFEGHAWRNVRRGPFTAIVVACWIAAACSSPHPQSGTNTNWACKVDADCNDSSKPKCGEHGYCVAPSAEPDSGTPPTKGSPSASLRDGMAPPSNSDAANNPGASDAGLCGDSLVAGTEECDPPDPDKGCSLDCRFICKSDDATRDCTPVDECNGASTCDDSKHLCTPRTPQLDYTPCGPNGTMQCIDGVCSH